MPLDDQNAMLVEGVCDGLAAFAKMRGSLSVARNGGSEPALRAHILGYLEQATDTIAFTEAAGERADIVLVERSAPYAPVVLMELKHNLLHQHQLRSIKAARASAIDRLDGARMGTAAGARCYYLHFVFGLDGSHESATAQVHNQRVGTAYKQFLTTERLSGLKHTLEDDMGKSLGPYSLQTPIESDPAKATLWAWLFEVEPVGATEQLVNLSDGSTLNLT